MPIMRKLSVVTVGLLFAACGCAAAQDREPIKLTLMTYNVGSAAGVPLGPEQIAQLANEIKTAGADVVGMTEVDFNTDWRGRRDMVCEIGLALAKAGYPMHHYYTPTLTYHGGNMVLVLWSRYGIVDSGYRITVPEGPHGWKVASVTIEPERGRKVHVFMTHYWIGDGSKHKHQTDTVIDYAKQFTGPRILLGDFNFRPEQPYHQQILDAGYQDSCEVVHGAPCPTVGRGGGKASPDRVHQIDFIFGSPDVTFTDTYVPETTVSDHWPLVAKVAIQ
jgi:endonuclease/exonuclease/phosphatase family metal-dependent hydrolase